MLVRSNLCDFCHYFRAIFRLRFCLFSTANCGTNVKPYVFSTFQKTAILNLSIIVPSNILLKLSLALSLPAQWQKVWFFFSIWCRSLQINFCGQSCNNWHNSQFKEKNCENPFGKWKSMLESTYLVLQLSPENINKMEKTNQKSKNSPF